MFGRVIRILGLSALAIIMVSVPVLAQGTNLWLDNLISSAPGNDYAVAGQQGYQFTVGANDLVVDALGRGLQSNGTLAMAHTIRIWDVLTQSTIAHAVVDGNSSTAGSFAYANLSQTVTLVAGNKYRITSTESQGNFWGGGPDPWNHTYHVQDNFNAWGTVDGSIYVWENQNQPGGFNGAYPDAFSGVANEIYSQPTFFVAAQDVPEPGSMLALGSGLIGLAGFMIRRRRA